jgi:type IV pilus biogenesis protein CpaD/CtpE
MFKSFSNKMLRKFTPVLLVLALPLAGCAADQWAEDDTPFVPYGGSKTHPIKVVGNKATVADCGEWSIDSTESQSNMLLPNHGCAVQANIAAMAAYPQDLVKLRRMPLPPATPRVAAINAISAPAGASSGALPIAGSTKPTP